MRPSGVIDLLRTRSYKGPFDCRSILLFRKGARFCQKRRLGFQIITSDVFIQAALAVPYMQLSLSYARSPKLPA